MDLHVTSQQAAHSLEELIDRVANDSTTVTIERNGQPVAKLVAAVAKSPPMGKLLTPDDIAAITAAVAQLDDGWADAAEQAITNGNQPLPAESPWDR